MNCCLYPHEQIIARFKSIPLKYWILISLVFIVHLPAEITTAYAVGYHGAVEANYVVGETFNVFGVVPALIMINIFTFFAFVSLARLCIISKSERTLKYIFGFFIVCASYDSFTDTLGFINSPYHAMFFHAAATVIALNGMLPIMGMG